MKALDKNGFKIKKYECYHVHNADLGLDDAKMTHECFVIKISKKNNKSKVVTITSLETYKAKTNQYSFKNWKLKNYPNIYFSIVDVCAFKDKFILFESVFRK